MTSIWGELKRRNVFKVVVAYTIVSWLLIQVADTLLPAFDAPPWVFRVVVLLLGMGFILAFVLAWIYEITPQGIRTTSSLPPGAIVMHPGHRLNYLILVLLVLAVGFLLVDQYVLERTLRAPPSPQPTPIVAETPGRLQRFTINLGPTEPIARLGGYLSAHVALSRDGSRLAYVVQQEARTQLYIRALDELEARAVPDTEFSRYPFFSPDGEWLGYTAIRELDRVSVLGGRTTTLAQASAIRSAAWGDDDRIVFCARGDYFESLLAIPSTGGPAEPMTIPDSSLSLYCDPSVLPGGDAVLFTARTDPGAITSQASVAVFSRSTGRLKMLVEDGFGPSYVAATGHLLFARAGTIWAMPFDPVTLEPKGPEVPVVEGVQTNSDSGTVAYAASETGMLVYVRGGEVTGGEMRSLVWVDREGFERPAIDEQRPFLQARLSPDGGRVALVIEEAGNRDIWTYDLESGNSNRLTFDEAEDVTPLWTPDGQRIVFSSSRDGGGIFWKAADGTGPIERLTSAAEPQYPEAFSPDGSLLVYRQEPGPSDLHILSMTDQSTQPLFTTPLDEDYSAISPDGHWIAYEEDQEVYVKPFPNVDAGKWQISRGGGNEPIWNPNGKELFYRQDDGGPVLAVAVEADPETLTFRAQSPRLLFDALSLDSEPTYSIAPDGERFLMVSAAEYRARQSQDTVLVVVNNWFDELRRLAPAETAQ